MNESINGAITISDSVEKKSVSDKKILYMFFKRTFDILGAILGCLLLLPVIVIVKICYMCNKDFTSIFFVQNRIGKDGKVFKLYKFRSMSPNAEDILKELLKDPKYKKEWDENQKFHDDPRLTKIGKYLRKTSIDEMPQFLNILNGDMSFIGPRPLVKGELEEHNGNHRIYESVKPGITGWWACNGRSNTTYEERLDLEYYYIKNQSLSIDIKCIFLTIKAVIFKIGAK